MDAHTQVCQGPCGKELPAYAFKAHLTSFGELTRELWCRRCEKYAVNDGKRHPNPPRLVVMKVLAGGKMPH